MWIKQNFLLHAQDWICNKSLILELFDVEALFKSYMHGTITHLSSKSNLYYSSNSEILIGYVRNTNFKNFLFKF